MNRFSTLFAVGVAALLALHLIPSKAAAEEVDKLKYEVKVGNFSPTFTPGPLNAEGQTTGLINSQEKEANEKKFRKVTNDLAMVMAPPYGGPAGSIGQSATAIQILTTFALLTHMTPESGREEAWKMALGTEVPAGFVVGRLLFRKGLPNSFDIGGGVSYIFESNVFGISFNTKWAFLEGYKYAPDAALRIVGSTILGVKNLHQLSAGADLSLSKTFGVGSMAAISPWVSYQALFSFAGTPQIDTYPLDSRVAVAGEYDSMFSFPFQGVFSGRLSGGVNVTIWILDFGVEAAYGLGGLLLLQDDKAKEEKDVGSGVFQITASLGVDF